MKEEEPKEIEEKNNKDLLLGIDDAGRGPVIGPMCLAGCLMTPEVELELKKTGAKDSKLLTAKQRESLVGIIKQKALAWHTHLLSPAEIDTGMGEGLNLNQVEALAAATIINELTKNLSSEEKKKLTIIIDCPSNNKLSWLNQLSPYLKEKKFHIRCEHKADRDFAVVSAASIIAKTTRDSEIEKLKKEVGFDFGSGYPADPITKEALRDKKYKDILKSKRIIRETWSTWIELERASEENKRGKQKTLF